MDWQRVCVVQMDDYLYAGQNSRSFFEYINQKLVIPLEIHNFISIPRLAFRSLAEHYMRHYEKLLRLLGGLGLAWRWP